MPLCIHCLNDVDFEEHECQLVCPQCGSIKSSEYLTTDFQFSAPTSGTYGTLPLEKPYSVRENTDYYSTQRKKVLAYLHQCAKVLELEQYLPVALELFSMLIPPKQTVLELPKLRWGIKAEATAISCCLLASRIHGNFSSVRNASSKLKMDPYFIGRHLSEITHLLAQSGKLIFHPTMGDHLFSATQKWISFFSIPPEQSHVPSTMWIDSALLPRIQRIVKVLLGIAESVFEGQLIDPTALSLIVISKEVLQSKYLDTLPIALACRMAPTTLLQRQRDWHYIFYRLSRQLPWSKDIRRTNFPCFFYQIIELLEQDIKFVDVGLPLSYMKAEKKAIQLRDRVQQIQTRLSDLSSLTSAFTQDFTGLEMGIDNLDTAIETLLILGEPPEKLSFLSPSELFALYDDKRYQTNSITHDLNNVMLTSLDLSLNEEAMYLNQMNSEISVESLVIREQVGSTINEWPG